MPVNATVRTRLEAQGFCRLDDATLAELAPWMRWSLLYNYGARYLTRTPPLPKQGPQRRFAAGIRRKIEPASSGRT
jgi:hypothetical protein